jgi:hypothetical protein
MEHLEGQTLADRLKKGLSGRSGAASMVNVAEGDQPWPATRTFATQLILHIFNASPSGDRGLRLGLLK